MQFKVAIPARYGSTRLPGKPLRLLAGRPLIEHVYHCARASGANEVIIATDDERVAAVAERFGAAVCMTSSAHATGTDRLAEVVQQCAWPDDAIVVNLQGDEPLLPPELLRRVAHGLAEHPQAGIATVCVPIDEPPDLFDPNIVKVVLDAQSYALYFSRAPIPYHRNLFAAGQPELLPPAPLHYYRHIGLYAYRAKTLRAYPQLAPAPAEQAEALEQLRALWNGIRIHVQPITEQPPLGVDTEADLARVEAALCR